MENTIYGKIILGGKKSVKNRKLLNIIETMFLDCWITRLMN